MCDTDRLVLRYYRCLFMRMSRGSEISGADLVSLSVVVSRQELS
jgi:hypothetical protein